MSDVLRDGAAWLEQKRQEHLSSPVIYRRAAGDEREVLATVGKSLYKVTDASGFSVFTGMTDFIMATDLLAGEPEPGDQILHAGACYEVMNIPGEKCWRWSDSFRKVYRIHTKFIGTENEKLNYL